MSGQDQQEVADGDRERISREATDWLILLQDDPADASLHRRFADWRNADPRHADAWLVTRRTAGLIERTPPAHATTWQPFLDRRRAPATPADDPVRQSRPVGRRRILRWAGLAAAASLALAFGPGLAQRWQADYTTGTGEVRELRLADGSLVVMAPDSALAVRYDDGERRVRLLAGEVFCEVSPDAARPFRLMVEEVRSTVLGTAFDVRREADGAVVSVSHGVVGVDHVNQSSSGPGQVQRLSAGQSLSMSWSGEAVRGATPPGQVAAWRHGQLIAEDQPMRLVLDGLRPYFDGRIVLTDADLGERPVTGVYNLAAPEQALRAVARAHGGSIRRLTPWLLIVSAP